MNEANIENKVNNNLSRIKIRKSFTILERSLKPRPRADTKCADTKCADTKCADTKCADADTNFKITIRKKEIGVSQKLAPSPTCLILFWKRIKTWIHRFSAFCVNTLSQLDCIHVEKRNTIFPENV